MTGFSSLNTALSGLFAAQRAMDIAGQNVANSNTVGYSRQRVDLQSVGTTASATFHTGSHPSSVGGVQVGALVRIRDTFLEGARSDAGARLSALTTRASVLTGAEQLLSEPGESGTQQVLDDFFAGWHDLAQRPTDEAAGAVVLQRGEACADQLRSLALAVGERWVSAREDLANVVVEANQAAADLAALNRSIAEGTNSSQPVNELLDKRDQLVRKLGELVGGQAIPAADGSVTVAVNGISIVSGATAQTLTLAGASSITNVAGDPAHLRWQGATVPVVAGEAAGLLTGLGSDLPSLLSDVDAVAVALRDMVNAVHSSGFTLESASGGDFFSGTGASDLHVVLNDPTALAVSTTPGKTDGSNALAIADLADDRNAQATLGRPGPAELWRGVAASVGTSVQSLERAVGVQSAVVTTADDAAESDAGVNLDEEMTDMLLFQRAYQASARVITTVDEMLDTLINRTGTVGR
jgi:flagellar hook-associated protein 1 FlgK